MRGDVPHVVILGGGFGGLNAAKALAGAPVRVTLIDRNNHHLFQPLLYQVATAALSAPDIAAPIRKILHRQRNCEVLMATATAVDVEARQVALEGGPPLDYDYLVVATGAVNNYFGNDHWEAHAPGLKSLEEAIDIRRRILTAFEHAERVATEAERAPWLTFVIIGGGPTGVELAGSISEIARHTLARDYRNFDPRHARVVLVEGQDRVLSTFPEPLSRKAEAQLRKLGVELMLGQRVSSIDAEGVVLGTQRVAARTVLWGAGVQGSPLGATLGAERTRAGKVRVAEDLSLPGHPEVFVIGDLASLDRPDGGEVPGVAPAAIQGGQHAARMILNTLRHQPRAPFRYVDQGSLATIGRKAAIADFGRIRATGWLAWVLWLGIHIMVLIGFRNRLAVLFDWAWAYLTYQRSARVILTNTPARSPDTD
ncbi:MAG: NAD(P)/FAD-dependent oxidoreductase [Alphaproteobacteria bacterium]|nr:NAD(P)/FAD-dependent oxidoreductase [Alphaproteobacteria bacterium]